MTLQEMKAKAYDILANIEYLQLQLRQVNEQIRQESQPKTPKPEDLTPVDADIVS